MDPRKKYMNMIVLEIKSVHNDDKTALALSVCESFCQSVPLTISLSVNHIKWSIVYVIKSWSGRSQTSNDAFSFFLLMLECS